MKIYLADLVYDSSSTNFVLPLNIAFIASNLKHKFGNNVDITLFKYPKELEKYLKTSMPDVLGVSNYSWNTRLSKLFIREAKKLNPSLVTVMGGCNIRATRDGIYKFLCENPAFDYYIINEGEEPFANLIGGLLKGETRPIGNACCTIKNGRFYYSQEDYSKKTPVINQPSPYQTGWLDKFLKCPEMIPLLETNRGCPYRCAYCAWGSSTLYKIRQWPLEQIKGDIEYIAGHSVGQKVWIICDANFGIMGRDVEIAKSIRRIRDRKNFPLKVMLWYSKSANIRNLNIARILGDKKASITIQSSDQKVQRNIGRRAVEMDQLRAQINDYHNQSIEVGTDILIGLPGETAESHLNTLSTAFDIGFDGFYTGNIRVLPGTEFDTNNFREKYGIKTGFRPIFGAYGTYFDKNIFECEESVRATNDMSEEELNNFKIHHCLIGFCWTGKIFKPILKFGQERGINPIYVIDRLIKTEKNFLKNIFVLIKEEALDEWFETEKEMIGHFECSGNFDKLQKFKKLFFLNIVRFYQDRNIIKCMEEEIVEILTEKLKSMGKYDHIEFGNMVTLTNKLICYDLLAKESVIYEKATTNNIKLILGDNSFVSSSRIIPIEIYRPQNYIDFCKQNLVVNGEKDFSLNNLTKFLEMQGFDMLTNKVRISV